MSDKIEYSFWDEGTLAGHIDHNTPWNVNWPGYKFVPIFLGDLVSGPLVMVQESPRVPDVPGEDRPEYHPPSLHHHRTCTFRMALGDSERQQYIDRQWHGSGDYFVLEANKRYLDPVATDGYFGLIVFADRRGLMDITKDTKPMNGKELQGVVESVMGSCSGRFADMLESDDRAKVGVSMTGEEISRGGRFAGSVYDTSNWISLSDGSAIRAVFLGPTADDPVVIMSRNAPNVVEAPAGYAGTDMFRQIVKGACSVEGITLIRNSYAAHKQGTRLSQVVHGESGSTQVVVYADRSRWRPVGEADRPVEHARLDEIAAIIDACGKATSPSAAEAA